MALTASLECDHQLLEARIEELQLDPIHAITPLTGRLTFRHDGGPLLFPLPPMPRLYDGGTEPYKEAVLNEWAAALAIHLEHANVSVAAVVHAVQETYYNATGCWHDLGELAAARQLKLSTIIDKLAEERFGLNKTVLSYIAAHYTAPVRFARVRDVTNLNQHWLAHYGYACLRNNLRSSITRSTIRRVTLYRSPFLVELRVRSSYDLTKLSPQRLAQVLTETEQTLIKQGLMASQGSYTDFPLLEPRQSVPEALQVESQIYSTLSRLGAAASLTDHDRLACLLFLLPTSVRRHVEQELNLRSSTVDDLRTACLGVKDHNSIYQTAVETPTRLKFRNKLRNKFNHLVRSTKRSSHRTLVLQRSPQAAIEGPRVLESEGPQVVDSETFSMGCLCEEEALDAADLCLFTDEGDETAENSFIDDEDIFFT